jgi:RNA polymerase sigma-70 factor (ECF subfamily)
MTDEDIVKRVQSGDRMAFVELHKRYYQRIWRYVRRSVVDPDTASDIASETFLRAYRSIDRFKVRRDGSFSAFLFRIASNLLTDRARRQPKFQQVSLEDVQDLVEHVPSEEPIPLEQILQEERIARVRRALAQLPLSDRQIILLSYEKGLSVKEIASIMGKPSSTAVTSHLHRALCKLRNLLMGTEPNISEGDAQSALEKTEEAGSSG